MAKLVSSSAVQPNTFPPSASGATSIPLLPIGRLLTMTCLLRPRYQKAAFEEAFTTYL
jgi:hypothetical protein